MNVKEKKVTIAEFLQSLRQYLSQSAVIIKRQLVSFVLLYVCAFGLVIVGLDAQSSLGFAGYKLLVNLGSMVVVCGTFCLCIAGDKGVSLWSVLKNHQLRIKCLLFCLAWTAGTCAWWYVSNFEEARFQWGVFEALNKSFNILSAAIMTWFFMIPWVLNQDSFDHCAQRNSRFIKLNIEVALILYAISTTINAPSFMLFWLTPAVYLMWKDLLLDEGISKKETKKVKGHVGEHAEC